MPNQRFKPGPKARGRDHRVNLHPGAIREYRVAFLESFERRHDAHSARPHGIDDADIEDGDHAAPQKLGIGPGGCRQAEGGEVGNRDATKRRPDRIDDRHRQGLSRNAEHLTRNAERVATDDAGGRSNGEQDLGRAPVYEIDGDLGTRIPGPHDEHAPAPVGHRVAVLRGAEDLARKTTATEWRYASRRLRLLTR